MGQPNPWTTLVATLSGGFSKVDRPPAHHSIMFTKCNVQLKLKLTKGQTNLTQNGIATEHGSFSRIRQVAPICTAI